MPSAIAWDAHIALNSRVARGAKKAPVSTAYAPSGHRSPAGA
jgi:hypothetical protein